MAEAEARGVLWAALTPGKQWGEALHALRVLDQQAALFFWTQTKFEAWVSSDPSKQQTLNRTCMRWKDPLHSRPS